MRVDIGDVEQPEGGQRFHADGAQELAVENTVVANKAVLRLEEVKRGTLAFEHVPVFAQGFNQAKAFFVMKPLAGGQGLRAELDGELAQPGITHVAAALAALAANVVDAIQLVEISVGEVMGNGDRKSGV